MLRNQIFILAGLPILIFVYIPKPAIEKVQFLTYPFLAFVLSGIIFLLLNSKKNKIKLSSIIENKRIVFIISLLALNIFSLIISFIFNVNEIRQTSIVEIAKPVLFFIILLYGNIFACVDLCKCQQGLLLANYLIIFGQGIFVIIQSISPELISVFYSTDKLSALGGLRVTGTLANPNTFVWVVSFATISIYMLERNKYKKYLFLLFGSFLIFLSASRTGIILYPVLLLITNALEALLYQKKKKSISESQKIFLKFIVLLVLLAILLKVIIDVIPQHSPYFALLIESVQQQEDVAEISSLEKRLNWWENIYRLYFKDLDVLPWIFGIGSRSITRVVDNDYLYVFYRTGIFGLLIHFLTIFYALKVFIKTSKSNIIGLLGIVYILYSLMFGMMFDHLGGWNSPIFLFLLLGVSSRTLQNKNKFKVSLLRETEYA